MARAVGQDQAAVSITVDGRKLPWVFSKREGGGVTADANKSRPGAQGAEQANGGPASVDDITLEANFIPEQHHEDVRWLRTRVGKGDVDVSEQVTDVDGNGIGRPDTWTGVLIGCHHGDYDADSGDRRKIEVNIAADGIV